MSKQILLCGLDLPLLKTRAAVLNHDSFLTSYVYDLDALKHAIKANHPDLVILCHSLSAPEQQAAIALVREQQPAPKILVLTRQYVDQPKDGYHVISAFDGPRALVEMTRHLMAPQNS